MLLGEMVGQVKEKPTYSNYSFAPVIGKFNVELKQTCRFFACPREAGTLVMPSSLTLPGLCTVVLSRCACPWIFAIEMGARVHDLDTLCLVHGSCPLSNKVCAADHQEFSSSKI